MVMPIRGSDRLGRWPKWVELLANCLISRDDAREGVGRKMSRGQTVSSTYFRRRLYAFVGLVHVFDVPLQNKKIGRRQAVDL